MVASFPAQLFALLQPQPALRIAGRLWPPMVLTLMSSVGCFSAETTGWKVSRPGKSHPEPLSQPYVNLSAHTAPAMEPRRTPICQCAHNFGSRLEIRATQCAALRKCPRSFLYFR